MSMEISTSTDIIFYYFLFYVPVVLYDQYPKSSALSVLM